MQIRIHTHTHTLSLSLFLTHSGTCAHTTVDSLVHTRSHVRIPTPSRSEVRGYGIEAGWWHVCGTALVPARARGGAAGRRTTAFWAAGLHMANHAVVTIRTRLASRACGLRRLCVVSTGVQRQRQRQSGRQAAVRRLRGAPWGHQAVHVRAQGCRGTGAAMQGCVGAHELWLRC